MTPSHRADASRQGPTAWRRVALISFAAFLVALPLLTDVLVCPSRLLFGLPCPGCGLTRATRAMLSLDFGAMLRFHPLAPLALLLATWELARVGSYEVGASKPMLGRIPFIVWIGAAVAFVGLYLLRLAGHFGGLPDSVDPVHGVLGEMLTAFHRTD